MVFCYLNTLLLLNFTSMYKLLELLVFKSIIIDYIIVDSYNKIYTFIYV